MLIDHSVAALRLYRYRTASATQNSSRSPFKGELALVLLLAAASVLSTFDRGNAQEPLPQIIRRVQPAVVSLVARGPAGQSLGLGSGFVIADGRIVTNAHVVEGATQVEVFDFNNRLLGTASFVEAWSATVDLAVLPTHAYFSEDLLNGFFDPTSSRLLLNRLSALKPSWENIFGSIEEVSDQEAEFDRRQAELALRDRIENLTAILADPQLEEWAHRLGDISGDGMTFAKLLGVSAKGMKRRLREIGLEFAYATYSSSSEALHGSSYIEFVDGVDVLVPRVAGMGEHWPDHAGPSAAQLDLVPFLLSMLSDFVWETNGAS